MSRRQTSVISQSKCWQVALQVLPVRDGVIKSGVASSDLIRAIIPMIYFTAFMGWLRAERVERAVASVEPHQEIGLRRQSGGWGCYGCEDNR